MDWNGYPIIDDATPPQELFDPMRARGLVPRDPAEPHDPMLAPPSLIPLIPRSEWDARIKEQDALQSSLEHIYLGGSGGTPKFVNLDQNGNGYCWAYSTSQATMLGRLRDNMPHVRLNPHSVAAIIKRGADEGGWCGLSAKFLREHGVAVEGTGPGQWPLHSRDLRYDTPACRAEMARFKTTEDWVDISQNVWEQNLTFDQVASCLLGDQPCALDFNWWGHSVCGVRLVKVENGSYGIMILNSWKGWGRYGLAVLQGDRAIPMGAVCLRTSRAS